MEGGLKSIQRLDIDAARPLPEQSIRFRDGARPPDLKIAFQRLEFAHVPSGMQKARNQGTKMRLCAETF
jgi:hypothetical protein